jgi:hypothetical protein
MRTAIATIIAAACLLAGCATTDCGDDRLYGYWEPNDAAQGGRAVVMLPKHIEASRVVVNGEKSALSLGRVEGRAAFVMPRAGTLYHSHARVIAYQHDDMVDAWWVENPRKRSAFR